MTKQPGDATGAGCRRVFLWVVSALIGMTLSVPVLGADAVPTIDWTDLRPETDPRCNAIHARRMEPPRCDQSKALKIDEQDCAIAVVDPVGGPVRIAGYVHPLAFEFRDVRRFVLVPPVPRCKHPPPPPPNQMILVESEIGVDVGFDPVFVTGVLTAEPASTPLGQTRYRMKATAIAPAAIPDVIE